MNDGIRKEINEALSDINNIFKQIDDIYECATVDRLNTEYIIRGMKGKLSPPEEDEINLVILNELIKAREFASNMLDKARDYEYLVHEFVNKIDALVNGTDTG